MYIKFSENEPCKEIQAKRLDYLSWEEYFMAAAYLASRRSKDPSTQVNFCRSLFQVFAFFTI